MALHLFAMTEHLRRSSLAFFATQGSCATLGYAAKRRWRKDLPKVGGHSPPYKAQIAHARLGDSRLQLNMDFEQMKKRHKQELAAFSLCLY